MKPEFIELIGNARRRQGLKFRNRLSVFLVCLFISILLWMTVKLSAEYYYSIDYHIRVTGVPKNYTLVQLSDSILTVHMKLQGYDYVTDLLFESGSLSYNLDISTLKVRWKNETYQGFLLTNYLGHEITVASPFQKHLVSTTPDTLYFTFDRVH